MKAELFSIFKSRYSWGWWLLSFGKEGAERRALIGYIYTNGQSDHMMGEEVSGIFYLFWFRSVKLVNFYKSLEELILWKDKRDQDV